MELTVNTGSASKHLCGTTPHRSKHFQFRRSRLGISLTSDSLGTDYELHVRPPIDPDCSTPSPGRNGHTPIITRLPVPAQMLKLLRSATPQGPKNTLPTTGNLSSRPSHRILLVPIQLASCPSLDFDPITLDIKEGDAPLNIGRVGAPDSTKITFKSNVVSRAHAEIWVESGGKLFIRDTRSSSGTFINSSRLSPPHVESQPFQLRDGDVLQFGVTCQGADKSVYKCVMVWINGGPQAAPYVSKSIPSFQLSCPYVDIA